MTLKRRRFDALTAFAKVQGKSVTYPTETSQRAKKPNVT
jgi:hypothetical protein